MFSLLSRFSPLFLFSLFPLLSSHLGGEVEGSVSNEAAEVEPVSPGSPITSDNYRIRPSDLLTFSLFQEDDMLRQVRVEQDGSVILPLIGRVLIGGLTLGEAREVLFELYDRDFFVNPQISLIVLEFRPRTISVLGQVNRPGLVEIPPDRPLTILEAIAAANGFTRLGRSSNVQLSRVGEDGERYVRTINVDDIMRNPRTRNETLMENDTLFVPERIL